MSDEKQPSAEELAAFYRQQSKVLKARHEYMKLKAETAEFEFRHIQAVIQKEMITNPEKFNNESTGEEDTSK